MPPRALAGTLLAGLTASAVIAAVTTSAMGMPQTPTTPCALANSTTLLRNTTARVYSVHQPDRSPAVTASKIYGCLRATGRRVLIGVRITDGNVLSWTVGDLNLVGADVASLQSKTEACCPTGSTVVKLNDLSAGKHRSQALRGSLLTKLLVNRRGVLVWMDGTAAGDQTFGQLHILSTTGTRVLDEGYIAPASVMLNDAAISWTKGGVQHVTGAFNAR